MRRALRVQRRTHPRGPGGGLGNHLPPGLTGTSSLFSFAFDDSVDMSAQARFAFSFCAIESCGKCTPCRIGSTRGRETLDKIVAGVEPDKNKALLKDLMNVMADGSLCALGGLTHLPVSSAMKHFPQAFEPHNRST